jgi:hypothetical protein
VRSGVRIYDVISKSPVWLVTSEISQRGDVASCVARLGDRVEHSTSGRLVLISDWSDIGQLTLILTCHWSSQWQVEPNDYQMYWCTGMSM